MSFDGYMRSTEETGLTLDDIKKEWRKTEGRRRLHNQRRKGPLQSRTGGCCGQQIILPDDGEHQEETAGTKQFQDFDDPNAEVQQEEDSLLESQEDIPEYKAACLDVDELDPHEEDLLTSKIARSVSFDDDSFIDPKSGPPYPEDLSEVIELKSERLFRVINVDNSGMISLRSHSQLPQYLLMHSILQKAYTRYDSSSNSVAVPRYELVKKGYYVVKLGEWYHRCQFIKFVSPKEETGFDIRIRLLDFGVPQVVPVTVFRHMHPYFKNLPSQAITASLYDPKTKKILTMEGNWTNEVLQDNIYKTQIHRLIDIFPECPHVYCEFVSMSFD